MGCGLGWGEGRSHGPEAQRRTGLVVAQGRRGQVTEARAEKQAGPDLLKNLDMDSWSH